jgi:PIN domain nuclease of toxin-antitoxin system
MASGTPLSDQARSAIDEAFRGGSELFVSPITAWELGLLARKGRLPATVSPVDLFRSFVETDGVGIAQMSPEILVDSSFLPGEVHGDPADRIVIATARSDDLTIVTRDKAILSYAEQGYVRALAC